MFQKVTRIRNAVIGGLFGGAAATNWLGEVGLLVGRVYLGTTICKAGASKFPTADWFQDQVAGLGFSAPAIMAFLASTSEFVGGALLVVGLCTRPAAFFAAATMGVATFGFHRNYIGEMHIAQLYFWMFVLFSLVGAGRLSLDGLIRRQAEAGERQGNVPSVGMAIWLEQQPLKPPVDPRAKVEQVSLAGTFNSWNVNTHPMTCDSESIWKTTLEIATPGEVEFKFVVNRDWRSNLGDADQIEVGLPSSGIAELDNGNNSTSNIRAYIPAAGTYDVTLDTNSRAYELRSAADQGD